MVEAYSSGMEEGGQKQDIQNKKSGERIVGREFFLFREYNLQRLQSKQEESTEEEEKISLGKSDQKERMDAKNRWWVSELLAEDCEKAWTHTG